MVMWGTRLYSSVAGGRDGLIASVRDMDALLRIPVATPPLPTSEHLRYAADDLSHGPAWGRGRRLPVTVHAIIYCYRVEYMYS